MGRLVIEEVDETLIDGLVRLAATNSLSVEEQAKTLLERSLARHDRSDLIRRAEAIAALTPKGVPQTDSVQFLRQDRDR